MKNRSALILLIAAATLSACGSKQTNVKNNPTQDSTTAKTDSVVDPDPTDSIPADGYAAYNSNMDASAIIKTGLTENVFKSDLNSIPADQRKFKYHSYDLNNDKKDEYLVAPIGNYYCGTGGCSFYILDTDGKQLAGFTVSDFPVYVAATSTEGWSDLIITSDGKNHHIKMKNGKYPSNPSVEPLHKADLPDTTPKLLNIYEGAYPTFNF